MDIDTTVRAFPLNETDAVKIVSEICAIPMEDGVNFCITSVTNIMTDFEYPGIRMMLEARLARMWEQFRRKNFFVGDLPWEDVLDGVSEVMDTYILS